VRDSPPPLWHSGSPTFFSTCLFCCYCSLLSSSFFPHVGFGLSRGLCWSGPGLSVEYHIPLSSPCGLHLPKPSGHWRLAARGPSWFLHLTWSGDALRRLELWRSQSFASSQWFFP
jgi:hypothetical protein